MKKKPLVIGVIVIAFLLGLSTALALNRSSGPSGSSSQALPGGTTSESASASSNTSSDAETLSQAESSATSSQIESSLSGPADSSLEEVSLPASMDGDADPGEPQPNFSESGSTYEDIMVNVMTCLLSQDFSTLAGYVGENGLELSPMGSLKDTDVTLTAGDTAMFLESGVQNFGTYEGTGDAIMMDGDTYYHTYMIPSTFDFASSTTSYDDPADLALCGTLTDIHTVSYYYAPDPVGWMKMILVYQTENGGDKLRAVIYQDTTTENAYGQ